MPADIRQLTDIELSEISVYADSVSVALAADEAYALGDEAVARKVYTQWARARKTARLIPPPIRFHSSTKDRFLRGLAAWATLSVILSLSLASNSTGEEPLLLASPLQAIIGAALLSGLMAIIAYPLARIFPRLNYAVITPMSQDEFRERRNNARHQLRSNLISIASVAVAVVAILVAALK